MTVETVLDRILRGEIQARDSVVQCPACEDNPTHNSSLKYCELKCVRVHADIREGSNRFVSATTNSDQPNPHLHIKCDTCGFEWLELPAWTGVPDDDPGIDEGA